MATSVVDNLPPDEDSLASLAADTGRPEELRDEAFARLRATIEWVARRLAVRFAGQFRSDVIADAQGDIWMVISRFPSGGSFEAWCYAVLRNKWLEEVERDDRRRVRELHAGELAVADSQLRSALEQASDSADTFGTDDLALIAAWPHRDRLVLLCLAGLWHKIPGHEWTCWVGEYRDRHGVPDDPFPPNALAGCDQLAARNEVLAVALHLKRNTLSVALYRGKFRLSELRYVRDRIGHEGGTQP